MIGKYIRTNLSLNSIISKRAPLSNLHTIVLKQNTATEWGAHVIILEYFKLYLYLGGFPRANKRNFN